MKQEDWARQLEHRLADHQEAPSHDLWTDIEARMAEDSGKAARLAPLRRWSAVAAAVLLAFGGAYLWWQQREPEAVADGRAQTVTAMAGAGEKTSDTPVAEPDERISGGPVAEAISQTAMPLAYNNEAGPHVKQAAQQRQTAYVEQEAIEEGPMSALPAKEEPASPATDSRQATTITAPSQHQEAYPSTIASAHHRSVALSLYASNGLTSYNDRSPVMMSPLMAARFDYGYQSSSSMVRARSTIYLADVEERQQHSQPVSFGLTASYPIGRRFSLSAGVAYTRLGSTFTSIVRGSEIERRQTLHYLGIPLTLRWDAWRYHGLKVYLAAGAQADWNIKARSEIQGAALPMDKDGMQWSVGGSLGVQYDVLPWLGIYAEPGLRHYFDNGSPVRNYFKDHPTNFSLQIGLRLNLGPDLAK